MAVIVMVDGGSNITRAMLKKYDIALLPYNVIFRNGDCYKDIKSQKDLATLIDSHNELPIVDQVSEVEIENCFRKYIDKGDDILYICVSSSLSNAYDKVVKVAKKFNSSTIEIMDSANVGGGEALLALYAKDYINKGYGLKQVTKYLNNIKRNIKSCYSVGNPNYLYRQNRCKHIYKERFDFCYKMPILEVVNGKIILTFDANDTELAIQMFKNMILDCSRKINFNHFIISYSGNKSYALKLKCYASKILKGVNVEVVENNVTIFINTGYNSLGLAFLIDEE